MNIFFFNVGWGTRCYLTRYRDDDDDDNTFPEEERGKEEKTLSSAQLTSPQKK